MILAPSRRGRPSGVAPRRFEDAVAAFEPRGDAERDPWPSTSRPGTGCPGRRSLAGVAVGVETTETFEKKSRKTTGCRGSASRVSPRRNVMWISAPVWAVSGRRAPAAVLIDAPPPAPATTPALAPRRPRRQARRRRPPHGLEVDVLQGLPHHQVGEGVALAPPGSSPPAGGEGRGLHSAARLHPVAAPPPLSVAVVPGPMVAARATTSRDGRCPKVTTRVRRRRKSVRRRQVVRGSLQE